MTTSESFPRPLNQRERAILDFMLSVDAPGVNELRAQAATAEVSGRCDCGCATIDLSVDRATSPRTSIREHVAIDTHTVPDDEPGSLYELIVFVDDGWLSRVEIVYYGDSPPTEFPRPDVFQPPVARV